jgi:two-component system CheB/CheR fusion protein
MALREAMLHSPDVVLLDIGLPGMSGWDVARSLRQLPETRRALLVAMSGYGSSSDRMKSQEAGFDLHLLKPVAPDLLEAVLSDLSSRETTCPGEGEGRSRQEGDSGDSEGDSPGETLFENKLFDVPRR